MNQSHPSFLLPGGLFDMSDSDQEIAFRFAVDRVNADRSVLPNTRLTAQIERIPPQDSFYAAKQGERDSQSVEKAAMFLPAA